MQAVPGATPIVEQIRRPPASLLVGGGIDEAAGVNGGRGQQFAERGLVGNGGQRDLVCPQ